MTRISIFILAIFAAAPLYADAPMVGKNLLPNETFENRPGFKDETPRDWGSWNSDYNGLSTIVHRKGQQSVYFTSPKQGDSTGILWTYKNVKTGDKYTFSAYAMNCAEDPISGNAFGQLSIEWRKTTKDKDNKELQLEISRDFGPKFGPELSSMRWTFFTMSAVAPVDADNCNFVIQFFNKENGGGKYFADDASAGETAKSIAVKDFLLAKSRPATKTGTVLEKNNTATEAARPEKAESSMVAADFDSGSKPNNIGGDLGTWNKDPNDKTQGCNMSFSQAAKHGDKGFSLQLDYDVDSPNKGAMDGFWMVLQKQNVSQYDRLSFWIKGDDSLGFSKSIKLELKNSKGEVGKYTLSGITKDWKRFLIPLSQFAELKDLSSMTEFVIRFDDEVNADRKTGRIYVDDISFVK